MYSIKNGLVALGAIAILTSKSYATFDAMTRITQILQKAQTLSVKCSVKSGGEASQKQLIEMMKPNLIRITTGSQTITANGEVIESTDEVGKVRSRIKQTPDSFRALLQTPSLRLWTAFFDASAFSNCSVKPLDTDLLQGKLYDSIQVEWRAPPIGGFKAVFDSQSGLPKELTGFSEAVADSARVSITKIDIDPKFGAEVFGANKDVNQVGKDKIGDVFSLKWSKSSSQAKTQLFPRKGKFEFYGDVQETRASLHSSTPWITLALLVDGKKHSEGKFGENSKTWGLTLDSNLISEEAHLITIQAEFDDRNFQHQKIEIGTVKAVLVNEVQLSFASLAQKVDGTLSVRLAKDPEIEAKLTINVAGRNAPATSLKEEMSVELDNIEPGKQVVTGVLTTENGFNIPIKPENVDVAFMHKASLIDSTPISITQDKSEGFLTVQFESASELGKIQVDISNSTIRLGNVVMNDGKVKVDFAALINGRNDLVFRQKLPNGKTIVLGSVELTASIDVAVQRERTVQRLFSLMYPNFHIASCAFCCAASGSNQPEAIINAFEVSGKRVPRTHEWGVANSWQPNSKVISTIRPPLTTDAKFNEDYVDCFKAGLSSLTSLQEACYQMSLARGEDGIIKRSNPTNLSSNLLSMVSAINLADDSARSASKELSAFLKFFDLYSKNLSGRFKGDASIISTFSPLWDSHREQVAFLRTISAIVKAFPNEGQLSEIANSLGRGKSTLWTESVKIAIQKLIAANQDMKKLNDLNDKLNGEKSTNRKNELKAQIAALKAQIVQEQFDAWEIFRKTGDDLGIILDGIWEAAPKVSPDP